MRSLPALSAAVLGGGHLLAVGPAFIAAGGGGERLTYIIFLDLPLFLMAKLLTPRLLFNSVPYNFLLFVIGGSAMYAAVGYGLGMAIRGGWNRRRASS